MINNYNIILASSSPRRISLMRDTGFKFEIRNISFDEEYPSDLKATDVAIYLACKKSDYFKEVLNDELIITADTTVCLDGEIIGKPKDREDAVNILKKLSGNKHSVITGVCLKMKDKVISFSECTYVYFKDLNDEEINYYVDNFKPYDKAGAYGIQEWIGYIGVEKIEGSFFNVMGLPIHRLYNEINTINKFI